jgi:hypothetical protein
MTAKFGMKPVTRGFDWFNKFTDDEWERILGEIPAKGPHDKFRSFVEMSLFLYTHNRSLRTETGNILISGEFEDGDEASPEATRWYEYDLQAGHRRLAQAAREMIDAYEPMLHPDWEGNWGEKSINDMESICDRLRAILEYSEARAAFLEKEKREDRGAFGNGRGRRRDADLRCLIAALIRDWRACGGFIGGGNQNGRGGPLVRFLIAATKSVLSAPPTTETARHWIREYKRWEKERHAVARDR